MAADDRVAETADRLVVTSVAAPGRGVSLRLDGLERALRRGLVVAHLALERSPRRLAARILEHDSSAREAFANDAAWLSTYLQRVAERHRGELREAVPYANGLEALRAFAAAVTVAAGPDLPELGRRIVATDDALDLAGALQQLDAARNRLPRGATTARRTDRSTDPKGGGHFR